MPTDTKAEDWSPAEIERGRILFAQECTFERGVAELSQLPPAGLPEVAFAGRSNVGKSSLVNALTGRKTLARTSNTPGRTQQLNFFDLGGRLRLVDLPGYGYAKVSKTQVAQWTDMMVRFLRGRVPLRRVCLLVDGRHGIKANDAEMMDMLDDTAVSYQVILTKTDKVKGPALETLIAETSAALTNRPAAHPVPLPTSAETGFGVPDLRATLATYAD